MFCSRCGTQIQDNAAFCHACGNAVNQNACAQPNAQQPQAQQPVDNSYLHTPDKADVNIVYPDGHNEIGVLYITGNELVFHKKSKAVLLAFGFIGNHIESGDLKLRINTADIISGSRTRYGLNGNVYQITLRNGQNYKICFNNPAKINLLAMRFG